MHWSEFGIRSSPPMSARSRVETIPVPLQPVVEQRRTLLQEPLSGVTLEGVIRSDLFALSPTGVSTEPIAEAAAAFLSALSPEQRARVQFPLDSDAWRSWINVHMNFFRHGVMLEELSVTGRQLGLELLRTTLSAPGYSHARGIMRLKFMGSEPCQVESGAFAGTTVFEQEERIGLDLIRSLDRDQAAQALLRPSIHPDDLPPELQQPFDGQMRAGAFMDNAVIGNEGVSATALTDAQRGLLRALVGTFVGWTRDGHADVKMTEVDAHLDETWFAWMGSTTDGPFYYRAQSPVVLIEFDHLPGIVFDNDVPSRHHVHSIVRTPNGGDYGADLLRQHHERFDHTSGGRSDPHGSGRST